MQRVVVAFCLTIAFTFGFMNVIVFAETSAETLQSLVANARDAQARGDFRSAAEAYRKATELDSSIPELWANLGLMYHQLGKHTEAIVSFRQAIKLNSSLFVPQLFLGIDYLEIQKPDAALPFLETATRLNPKDPYAELNLGKAFAMLNRDERAIEAFWKTIRLVPNDGGAWLGLGNAYLQHVDSDARLMTTSYNHSPYVNLRAAETLAEEDKLVQAEKAFKAAIASAIAVPCAHASLGITLLRENKIAEAREQFEAETRNESNCGLAALGNAVAEAAEGHSDIALKSLYSIAAADSGFLQSNLYLFRGALSADQARELAEMARKQQSTGDLTIDFGLIVEQAFLSGIAPAAEIDEGSLPQTTGELMPVDAERLYAAGKYSACAQALNPEWETLNSAQQQLLAFCSFYAGDFLTTAKIAERQKTNPATLVRGLYWETKADQKLAIATLTRAGEINPDSPRMHVLTGDVFRQRRHWSEAEAEYRKALAIDPTSHGARLSLGIVLFTELKTDEALQIAKSLLTEAPDDPEANMLAGEILAQEHKFEDAEQYLSRCRNLDPDLIPRLHILLGQVYAATNRTPAAIAEYKLGMLSDEDGSIHYQLARLYLKTGDKKSADEAIQVSKQLRQRWDSSGSAAVEQLSSEISRQ